MSVPNLSPEQIVELDATVARAHDAAEAFRQLDQEAVDRIVWAMVTAGLDSAVDLALAGPSKRPASASSRTRSSRTTWRPSSSTTTSGTRRRSASSRPTPQRGIDYVAEPIGRRARDHPDHEPDVHRAVQGDRRGQDPQRDHLPAVARSRPAAPSGSSRCCARPGRRRACRRAPSRSSPTRAHEVTHHLFAHPGRRLHLDDRRPEDRRADQQGRQARRSASAPATRRSTCTAPPTSGWPSSTS